MYLQPEQRLRMSGPGPVLPYMPFMAFTLLSLDAWLHFSLCKKVGMETEKDVM
jgi:hypothetical protein